MKNHYLVLKWQEIFLNSYYYGRCMQGCCFRNFEMWSLLVEQPNRYSSECILTREFRKFIVAWVSNGFSYQSILTQFRKFLVTWVATKWFLIWVYSDMFIQMWKFGKFLVTLGAAKWVFISLYFDLRVCKNFSSLEKQKNSSSYQHQFVKTRFRRVWSKMS